MIKSPLRYPGGKSRAVQFLVQFIPPYSEFRDVFLGGGSLSLYCLQQEPSKKYLASDLNYELYCFWQQLKQHPAPVIAGIQEVYNAYKRDRAGDGKALFAEILKRRNDQLSDRQRAIDFFILNRISFSGVVDSGGYSQASFDARFTWSAIDRLTRVSELVRHIDFFCEDYSYLVNKEGKDVFLFLDPPYHSATPSRLYGRNGILHTQFDHAQLKEILSATSHKWLITYDDSDYIRQLYKNFYQKEWRLQYGMTNSNKSPSVLGKELLIANYDLE